MRQHFPLTPGTLQYTDVAVAMKIKFFVQRYKIVYWLSLLLSVFFLYQTIRSCQKEKFMTKERQEIKQRVDNNVKKANLLKNKAERVIVEANRVKDESQSCLTKKNPLLNECERILSKSLALTNELSSIIEQYKKVTDEVKEDNCFLYSDGNNKYCQKPANED